MLEIMGVPHDICVRHPKDHPTGSYPRVFRSSPDLLTEWADLCRAVSSNLLPSHAWNMVLRRFINWSRLTGRNIWPETVNRVDNNRIQAFLLLRRRWITQYLDSLGVLRDMQWNKVERSVSQDRLGITVNSSLHCRNIDPVALRQVFEAQRWRPNLQQKVGYGLGYRDWWRWIKVSETGITRVGFSAAGAERGIFWYNIVVPNHPLIPEGEDLEPFVLNRLWDPAVRTLRFTTLKRISQF